MGGHSRIVVTLKRLTNFFYWKGLKNDVRQYVQECELCRRHKSENISPVGLLQPLPIPDIVWADIAMDFIEGLPSSKGKEVILVVVDGLSKYNHFIALSHLYRAPIVAQAFLNYICKLHGMPKSIVSERDLIFLSNF